MVEMVTDGMVQVTSRWCGRLKVSYLGLWLTCLWAQSQTLSLQALYQAIQERHPLWRAITLGPDIAAAQLQATRSVWDPVLSASYTAKDFKNQLYYTLFNADLKVPIWNAFDLKALYEKTFGFSLNPEDLTPDAGLVGVGLSIPLGQGLLIDYRRAAIEKAKLYFRLSYPERQLLAANFLYEVAVDYWGWFSAYYKAQVYQQQLWVAESRYRFLKEAFLQGEASRFDTLEAALEVALRRQQLQNAQGELIKKALLVARHLWPPDEESLEAFPARYVPDSALPYLPPEKWVELVNTHPKLQIYELKRRILQIERRWAAEQLRPRLQVDYAFLRDPKKWEVGWSRPFETNYKLAITFGMPLYLRQARGQLSETRLRMLQLESEQLFEARSLYSKALGQKALIDALYEQLKAQESVVQGLFELIALENERFRAGESDLFVINRREREAFSALLNLYDLYARYGMAVAEFGAIVAWVP